MSLADELIPVREEDGKRDIRGLLLRIFQWRKWYTNIAILLIVSFGISFFIQWISHTDLSSEKLSFGQIIGTLITELKWVYSHQIQYLSATLFIFIVSLAIYSLTNSTGITVFLSGFIFFAVSTVNYFKLVTRNEPLLPWDFILVRAAASIVSDVELDVTPQIIITAIVIAAMAIGCLLLNKAYGKNHFRPVKRLNAHILSRLTFFVVFIGVIGLYINGFYLNPGFLKQNGISTNAWDQKLDYETNGVVTNLLVNIRYLMVDKPVNYSKQTVDDLVNTIIPSKNYSTVKPNIIIVMDESYGDADLLKNFTYSQKVTATTDYLKKDAVSGDALTCIFGGGTSVSEFMVLTGYNCDFLPPGCTPYQQYVNSTLPSYASFMRDQGYSTVAIHSYGATFWNRNVAYPCLGFEKFVSSADFVNPERRRKFNYISDLETMKKVVSEYQNNKATTNKPFFNLTVTIQNHQSYYPSDYSNQDMVKITSSAKIDDATKATFESYVTGLRDADQALGYLINYFRNVKDPTIILFFGDHWGKTGTLDEAYTAAGLLDGTIYSSPENTRKGYSTPFYIWDNYVHKNVKAGNLSMYQLLPYLTKLYNLPRSLYFDYLTQQSAVVRGSYRNLKLDGNGVATFKATNEMKEALSKQQLLQYDIMFGKGYARDTLTK